MSTDDRSREPAATLEMAKSVAIITPNGPGALNAVDAELSGAVGEALEELDADSQLRVGIITGAGRALCAGADLKALAAGQPLTAPGRPEWGFAGVVERYISKPLIAAVNGFALGGGTEIVLACDLAVVSEESVLGLPEVKRGLFAAAGGLIRMPRQVPMKVAMELALTGEPIDPHTAQRWGLVNRVVPADQVMSSALQLAQAIAANAPLAVSASKKIIHRASARDSDWDRDVWRLQDQELSSILTSDDAKEGTQAFAQKRKPVWTDS